MSLATLLIRERAYCEEPTCLNKAKVCRTVNGHNVVYCWQHDPEQVQDFITWLESTGNTLPEPQDFPEFLTRRGDAI